MEDLHVWCRWTGALPADIGIESIEDDVLPNGFQARYMSRVQQLKCNNLDLLPTNHEGCRSILQADTSNQVMKVAMKSHAD